MTLEIVPVTRDQARAFIKEHHRHAPRTVGDILRAGIAQDGVLVGVGIAGRPVARALCDGRTLEVTRVAVVDAPNGCSMLYGALWRAGRALGWQRMITYTRADEPGTSPRAAGAVLTQRNRARTETWSTPTRPRDTIGYDAIERDRWEWRTSVTPPL